MCVSLFFGSRRGARGKVVKKDLWPRALHPLFNFVLFCFFFCLILFLFFLGSRRGARGKVVKKRPLASGPSPTVSLFFVFFYKGTTH